MGKIGSVIVREVKEALPATIFFFFLFHMVSLTKAVAIDDYSIDAVRAVTATLGALLVAKAILLVEALSIASIFSSRLAAHIAWKTILFATVALLFRLLEEAIHMRSEYGGIVAAMRGLGRGIQWPLFWITMMWVTSGLLLFTAASELSRLAGRGRMREMLSGPAAAKPHH